MLGKLQQEGPKFNINSVNPLSQNNIYFVTKSLYQMITGYHLTLKKTV